MVRRSRQQRDSQIRTIISRNSSRRSNRSGGLGSRGSSIHSIGSGSLGSGSAKKYVVERELVGMSDVKGPWRIRSAALEHARGASDEYRGVGHGKKSSIGSIGSGSMTLIGKNVDEFKAGPPYIPSRSPERTFGSLRREFGDL